MLVSNTKFRTFIINISIVRVQILHNCRIFLNFKIIKTETIKINFHYMSFEIITTVKIITCFAKISYNPKVICTIEITKSQILNSKTILKISNLNC